MAQTQHIKNILEREIKNDNYSHISAGTLNRFKADPGIEVELPAEMSPACEK